MVPLRYVIAIPHYIWWAVFRLFVTIVAPINWILTVILGRPPDVLQEFLGGYIKYRTQLVAYLTLMADGYPGFAAVLRYPVEATVPEAPEWNRLLALFRPIILIPAYIGVVLVTWVLIGFTVIAIVASLILGMMPIRLQFLGLTLLRFVNETAAYSFMLTSTYPSLTPRNGASW